MVFAPKGGGTRSFSVPAPGLTWRAWGLFHYFADSEGDTAEPRLVEEDVAFSLALPLPKGPPLVHELVRDQPRE
jgi:hypothetical protein